MRKTLPPGLPFSRRLPQKSSKKNRNVSKRVCRVPGRWEHTVFLFCSGGEKKKEQKHSRGLTCAELAQCVYQSLSRSLFFSRRRDGTCSSGAVAVAVNFLGKRLHSQERPPPPGDRVQISPFPFPRGEATPIETVYSIGFVFPRWVTGPLYHLYSNVDHPAYGK